MGPDFSSLSSFLSLISNSVSVNLNPIMKIE
jgi:hypothetical protein